MRNIHRLILLFVVCSTALVNAGAGAASAEPPLTNADVIRLVKTGLSVEIVIEKISASACDFQTAVDDLIALKSAGVPDRVVSAMMNCSRTAAPKQDPPASTSPVPPSAMTRNEGQKESEKSAGPFNVQGLWRSPRPTRGRCGGTVMVTDSGMTFTSNGFFAKRPDCSEFEVPWKDIEKVCADFGFSRDLVNFTTSGQVLQVQITSYEMTEFKKDPAAPGNFQLSDTYVKVTKEPKEFASELLDAIRPHMKSADAVSPSCK